MLCVIERFLSQPETLSEEHLLFLTLSLAPMVKLEQ